MHGKVMKHRKRSQQQAKTTKTQSQIETGRDRESPGGLGVPQCFHHWGWGSVPGWGAMTSTSCIV